MDSEAWNGERGKCLQPALTLARLEAEFEPLTCQLSGCEVGASLSLQVWIGTGFWCWSCCGKGPGSGVGLHRASCGMMGFVGGLDPISRMKRIFVA